MLPQSLVAFTATLLVPLIAAASTPSCQPSNFGADLDSFKNSSVQFCNKLADESFAFDVNMYGVQKSIVSFQFTPQNAPNTTCNLSACTSGAAALATICASDSHTIYGSGSTDLGCGMYNFTITPQTIETTPTPLPTPSRTSKPNVGSTALGSRANIVRGSGYAFVGVACVFAWFL